MSCFCFSVFNLEDVVPGQAARAGCMHYLHVLAKAFCVQPQEAVTEYFALLPLAHAMKQKEGRLRINHGSVASSRGDGPGEKPTGNEELPILVRYVAWGVSSSSVE